MDEAELIIELPDEGGQTAQGRRGDGDDGKYDTSDSDSISGTDSNASEGNKDLTVGHAAKLDISVLAGGKPGIIRSESMKDETQQASAERASPPADEDGQAEVPVATVARSQTVIAKTSREASERRVGGTTRDDGANQSEGER